jgi:hypothetical protein
LPETVKAGWVAARGIDNLEGTGFFREIEWLVSVRHDGMDNVERGGLLTADPKGPDWTKPMKGSLA